MSLKTYGFFSTEAYLLAGVCEYAQHGSSREEFISTQTIKPTFANAHIHAPVENECTEGWVSSVPEKVDHGLPRMPVADRGHVITTRNHNRFSIRKCLRQGL
ncbi:MAG TPA: hypothetical protein VHM27_10795, partial [Rhizomicrobium sp.]|nr:hypothetical protein [Rhizomicrobium sp.]